MATNQSAYTQAIFKPSYSEYIEKIKEERELNKCITTINQFLDIKENSDDYRTFVAREYKNQNYTVWEYSKEKNIPKEENQFDLLLKKKHDILFVKCRDDNVHIGLEEIEKFKNQIDEFIQKHKIFEQYKIKLRYTMSGLFLTEEAYEYIQENSDSIDYDIIKV
jgi:hypothetical protein